MPSSRISQLLAVTLLIGSTACVGASPAQQSRSGNDADIARDVWTDRRRDREIPVKLYLPEGPGPHPVVIFSHGLGGSREAAPYLGERWAREGFLGVFIQHPGSDASVWEGLPPRRARQALASAANPRTALQRFADLPFVIDEIERLTASGDLPADVSRIAMAGHSYGAHSVLAAIGRAYETPRGLTKIDDARVRAAIALSPPPPPDDAGDLGVIYGSIARPVLHLTGTEDGNPLVTSMSPASRQIPFREISGPAQYLVVFEGGDHMVFSGSEGARRGRRQPSWHADVQADVADLTTLFLKAKLLDDPVAAAALGAPDLARTLRHPAAIEHKPGSS